MWRDCLENRKNENEKKNFYERKIWKYTKIEYQKRKACKNDGFTDFSGT